LRGGPAAQDEAISDFERTFVDFDQSVILENEFRDNFKPSLLVQGLNLFGRCSQQNCRKKFIVKLGYGEFEIGKKWKNVNDSTFIEDLPQKGDTTVAESEVGEPDDLSLLLDGEFKKKEALEKSEQ